MSARLLLLSELGDGGDGAAEDHAEGGEDEGADARRALLNVVSQRLKDRLRRHGDGVERVAGQGLVGDHACNAHHGGAAIVALDVELELLSGEARHVLVPHPAKGDDISWGLVGLLRKHRVVEEGDDQHDLQPRKVGQRRPRGDRAARHVGVLDVLGEGQVARPADACLGQDHVQGCGHGDPTVLDLHLLKAAVLLRVLRHKLQRVINSERGGGADVSRRNC
mmetsp:Transcript_38843/g.81523  ORF Transcript_38843/g.81523 Transcript_38843/m.81523 type:complete len:222 (-) Transcript_38843:144-809(-)